MNERPMNEPGHRTTADRGLDEMTNVMLKGPDLWSFEPDSG